MAYAWGKVVTEHRKRKDGESFTKAYDRVRYWDREVRMPWLYDFGKSFPHMTHVNSVPLGWDTNLYNMLLKTIGITEHEREAWER